MATREHLAANRARYATRSKVRLWFLSLSPEGAELAWKDLLAFEKAALKVGEMRERGRQKRRRDRDGSR